MDHHRKICNITKNLLIKDAVNGVNYPYILDLCCGRGGDIFKWTKNNVANVLALDNHPDSVDEAINRYKKISKRTKTKISFLVKDVSVCDFTKLIRKKVSVVSCQFALHYFQYLSSFLTKVSDSLVSGGYFIGIVPDGDLIDQRLDSGVQTPNVLLDRTGPSSYFIKLVDSEENNGTQNYFEFRNMESREFMVRKYEFRELCEAVGLKYVSFCNLKDKYNGNHISELYFSFVFQKV